MKFSEFIGKLVRLKMLNEPFTFILDDPSGNSFVQNPLAPEPDPKMQIKHYVRTLEQDKLIGCVSSENNENDADKDFNITGEVLTFPTNCSECNAPCFTNMKVTTIPYFKEVIIMATNCEACGERTNEIRSGAGIEEKGVKITKFIRDENDLKLDVVRSDTCSVSIPEVDVEVSFSGNGRYTTVEGLIQSIKEELKRTNPFICGDSATNDTKEKMDALFNKLESLVGLTVILDDPCGNSFVEKADSVQNYERTFEQNEELGLNDMKTENYTSSS
ncbi:zinc finger protein ZPR1-like protein [Leptotrombidium deliense]|uniref:Zinc finger protein ZPR1-like protein n=1 Tax=Leptotrombidium deliense TaxID=299467 RepID=A0A443S1K0_9ACAR|nr:zinc finger protein ZPR1-like protein [Leptotrombidium deliense]